jgi:hypothetical protein
MADLAQIIRDLNSAWLEGRYDNLHAYFAADVVMLPPGGAGPITGVGSMVESIANSVRSELSIASRSCV